MTFKEFRQYKVVRFLSNRYILILLLFLVWMLFFDENSYLNHRELNRERSKIKNTIEFYDDGSEYDKKLIKNLQDPDSLEKFAREEYKMKRKDEDIFIIDFDSIKEK
ncbi:septum formation initiator family protein [Aureibaculum sp. A20]|uniref:Septum formation initiator family protein n=1 Tax=Aureibaculum flavum TaxID=2795986 RepID=A0ABS0WTX2_9FLAO|nr:septum formation initiator family protein [Aureibaculum flavum]MBJ2175424.1 septum formation initiator family protein [Aureibaculum flavum]